MTVLARAARIALVGSVSTLSILVSAAAAAQSIPAPADAPSAGSVGGAGNPGRSGGSASGTTSAADTGIEEIVVTAQRQAESLQDVPIAVSAFSAASLDRQQIRNPQDLQLTLPNITFTKTNFTSSSFTIRGIGDLCVGVTCDSATAIHVNDQPLFNTRLFETEFFDLERIEVLRGPQGTLFGRNATSGVVNFITAKPDLKSVHSAAEVEYGNYDSVKVKGMVNVPLTDRFGVRVAGYYLNRGGYTKNLFDDSRIDGRDMYGVRVSARWEPTDDTRVDMMGYFFHEKDDRLRIQKQLCDRDPTGILGCLPSGKGYGVTNGNATFPATLGSREFLQIQGGAALGAALAPLGLGSLYGPDIYANATNPNSLRTVNSDYNPSYFTHEKQLQLKVEHDFGNMKLSLNGMYQSSKVDSTEDYDLAVQSPATFGPGLAYLSAVSTSATPLALLAPVRQALIPNGIAGPYCTSLPEQTGTGVYGGHSICSATPQDLDRSVQSNHEYTGEAILESQFDGAFNFLVGGIYTDARVGENSYYVDSFGIDYVSGVLGVATTLGQRAAGNAAFPNSYLGTPTYRNNTADYGIKSYGLFGEAYYKFSDKLKLTAGLRYNNDRKTVTARSTLAAFPVPFGSTNAYASPFLATSFDADPGIAGNQAFQRRNAKFGEFTGRAVLDYKLSDDNLLYASYSRGYKSGGINPPLQPVFAVPDTFSPEFINSFEVGSKNTLMSGTLQLNLTGFYYQYKDLQLSRLVARTAVNDNVNADIYGLEAEFVLRPMPGLLFNAGASYLHSRVSKDKLLADTRDPSGGRADSVIIKDITNGSNCAVVSNAGSAAAANGFVAAVNGGIGASVGNPALLRAPAPFPAGSGVAATGAFSICSALQSSIDTPAAALRAAFATPTGALPFTVYGGGVPVDIKGNKLPGAPDYKLSAGLQYTLDFANGWSIVPRGDVAYTGKSYGLIFNDNIDRIKAYTVVNAQVQLNGLNDVWFARAFVQNLTKNNAITGLGVGDQSSGLFTNVFSLEPRRYGLAAGVRF